MTNLSNSSTEDTDIVEFTVDGKVARAAKGSNLLEALLAIREPISYFCYHPGLSVVAKCRQCLVGIGDAYRLVPACQTQVQEGMAVRSKDEQVEDARRALLEYTLLNHPVDCVICDKAGECALQRQYMDYDGADRNANHEKVRKPKKVDLGPEIVLDAERCILCDRCVRVCTEVAGVEELVFSERGDHTVLTTAPGRQLSNPYSLNTVDVCPVGALTDKDFRFKSRVWDLYSTRSVCTGCATGCAMEIHHKADRIYRLVPPKEWDMNLNWMCNFGRRTYRSHNSDSRILSARIGNQDVSLSDAISQAGIAFRELLDSAGTTRAGSFAFILSADATNEDNYALIRLSRHVPGARLYMADLADNHEGDDILRSNDPNPNRAGVLALLTEQSVRHCDHLASDIRSGKIKGLYAIGDLLTLPDDVPTRIAAMPFTLIQTSRPSALTEVVRIVLPASRWMEIDGTITNRFKNTARLRAAINSPAGVAPHWSWIQSVEKAVYPDADSSLSPDAEGIFNQLKTDGDYVDIRSLSDAAWGPRIPTQQLRWKGRRG